MEQALYRKYRSRTFDEVVGQDHVTATLKNAIKTGRISHAYLFTGPRGVGKTSVARILAHEINDLKYIDESAHLDIIEIDAASNRRIDEIRDLRDKVHTSPISVKYKVYIIDEVHMLTREAFNALLKTLEEPPAHCIFILATTEAHKLPQTIISRTQRFEFRPIAGAGASQYLAKIAKKEKINIDKEALDLLVEHGRGSFRDTVGLLDQLRSYGGPINDKTVRQFLGLPTASSIGGLAEAVANAQPAKVIDCLDELSRQGASATTIASLLSAKLRTTLVDDFSQLWITKLLKRLITIAASPSPDDELEIVLLQATLENQTTPSEKPRLLGDRPTGPNPEKAAKLVNAPIDEPDQPTNTEAKPAIRATKSFNEAVWNEIIQKSRSLDGSIYTALRLATPNLDSDTLSLSFRFALHQKKVSQAHQKELISKLASEVIGRKISVIALLNDSQPTKPPKSLNSPKSPANSISTISNIFGQAEVLES